MAQDCMPALPTQYTLTKNTRSFACQICRAPRETCERCRTGSVEVAMAPKFIKPNFVTPSAKNHACQICRAPREICERCLTAKRKAASTPSAQQTWTRITLARYQWS
jgi:hypothetical protein